MPPLIAAIVPVLASIGGGSALAGAATLAGLAGTGITIGEQLANQPGSAPTPQIPTGPTTPGPQTQATNLAQKAAVASSLPNLQSLTGGSLSPEYASQWAGLNTGLSGNPQAAGNIQATINQLFGFGASPGGPTGGFSTMTPSGSSISDLLPRAGIPPGGAPSGTLVDNLLNQDFRGFSV